MNSFYSLKHRFVYYCLLSVDEFFIRIIKLKKTLHSRGLVHLEISLARNVCQVNLNPSQEENSVGQNKQPSAILVAFAVFTSCCLMSEWEINYLFSNNLTFSTRALAGESGLEVQCVSKAN